MSRPALLSCFYSNKHQITSLADTNQVFCAEARDVSCVSLRTVLRGPAQAAGIVRGNLENLEYDKILAILPVGLIGFMLPEELE